MTGQQLKNSILQMAVQGKLVPQDPNDEPASVLLERIRAEKEKLIKEGKIKKEKNPSVIFRGADNLPYEKIGKNEPVCIADEVPFDIPESWEWVRFKNLVSYSMGKTPPRKESEYWTEPVYPWVSIADMNADSTILSTKEMVNEYAAEKTFRKRISKAGTLLMSFKLTVEKVSLLGIDAYHNEAIISIYPFVDNDAIITNYLFYIIPLISQSGQTKTAIKGNTLNSESLDALMIPLPPLREQERICKRLNDLKPKLSAYNKTYNEASLLNEGFPTRLKKSILQYAVQGKLVPQDPTDEPASVLLECIRAEKEHLIKSGKIKRDKHESVIFRRDNSYYERVDGIERCIDDEIPFEIPDSWEWVRLKNIVNVVSARRVHQSDWKESGVPFYRAREIAKLADDGYVDNELFISENLYNEFSKSGAPQSGDLMVTAVGTLGKVYIVQQTDKFYYKDASVICFMNFGKLNPEYLKLIMMSPFMVSAIKDHSTGTTVGTITLVTANEYLVPVPPFLEQTRIVAHFQKLNHLINACNM